MSRFPGETSSVPWRRRIADRAARLLLPGLLALTVAMPGGATESESIRVDICLGGKCKNGRLHSVTVTPELFIVHINPDRCNRRYHCPTSYESFTVEGGVPVRVRGYELGTKSTDRFTVSVPRQYKALFIHGINRSESFATVDLRPYESVVEPNKAPVFGTDTIPPSIELRVAGLEGERLLRTSDSTVTLEGRVLDNLSVGALEVAGEPVALGEDGRFSVPVELAPGSNSVTVRVVDGAGNEVTRELVLLRDLGPASTVGEERAAVAVVIGVEDYRYAPVATHAVNDAEVLANYLVERFGFPNEQVVLRFNERATRGELEMLFGRAGWLESHATDATDVVVYFAGHGVRDAASGELYLLPDVDPAYPTAGYALARLLEALGGVPGRSTTLILDVSFSGKTREGQPLPGPGRIGGPNATLPEVPPGVTLLLAAAPDRGSAGLADAPHGRFTFYLLRGLSGEADIDGDRSITAAELEVYVGAQVAADAERRGDEQRPIVLGKTAAAGPFAY